MTWELKKFFPQNLSFLSAEGLVLHNFFWYYQDQSVSLSWISNYVLQYVQQNYF